MLALRRQGLRRSFWRGRRGRWRLGAANERRQGDAEDLEHGAGAAGGGIAQDVALAALVGGQHHGAVGKARTGAQQPVEGAVLRQFVDPAEMDLLQ